MTGGHQSDAWHYVERFQKISMYLRWHKKPKIRLKTAQDDPRWPQDGPRSPMMNPKMAPERPKSAENRPRWAPRSAKMAQDCAKMDQVVAKLASWCALGANLDRHPSAIRPHPAQPGAIRKRLSPSWGTPGCPYYRTIAIAPQAHRKRWALFGILGPLGPTFGNFDVQIDPPTPPNH